ncbi:hypothetical protein [Desulfarculus baarsii]
MTIIIIIIGGFAVGLSLLIDLLFISKTCDIVSFYHNNLLGLIFSGFLTLTGFLASVATFIIVKAREIIFGQVEYGVRIAEIKKLGIDVSRYGPLKRLSYFSMFGIVSCLATSLMQVSLGMSDNDIAIRICIGSASFSCFVVLTVGVFLFLLARAVLDSLEPQRD